MWLSSRIHNYVRKTFQYGTKQEDQVDYFDLYKKNKAKKYHDTVSSKSVTKKTTYLQTLQAKNEK